MDSLSIRLGPEQFLDCLEYPPPHRPASQVAGLKHGIHAHGGLDRGVGAVLVHEEPGAAPDVEVIDHRWYILTLVR